MRLILDEEHPLAKGIISSTPNANEIWLVLRASDSSTSYFRAHLNQWTLNRDSSVVAEFESWEDYMERKARLAGL